MGPLWETYSHNQSIFRALAGLRSDSASDVLRSLVGGPRGSLDPDAIHCPDITFNSALQKRHHHQYHHYYHLKYSVVIAW